MTTPAGNEISVRVRIDGKLAMQDAEKLKKGLSDKLLKGGLSLTSSALGLFYGGIAGQARSAVTGIADLMGRGTGVGRDAAEFWGRAGAKTTAAQQTVEAFGLAGQNASKDQILSVYNMYKNLEEMRASSKANIEGAIGKEETTQLLKQVALNMNSIPTLLGNLIRALEVKLALR